MAKHICLLRAVNVGGRKVPMADLKDLAKQAGFKDPTTLLASGNLVVDAGRVTSSKLEATLEAAFTERFGFVSEFMCRSASTWAETLAGCPFPDEAKAEGSRVLLFVSKRAPAGDVVIRLQALASGGEKVARVGDDVWVYFAAGVGDSSLAKPAAVKAFATPTTGRNHNTVVKLAELVGALARV